ncbi:hypothetical protein [Mycobacterium sp. 1465703.0]|uniref:hypothetical protein n=1 Tax=Mycobacterium sp. 1465703.0 TaxID=1834078 RepID=UPI00080173F9|nr:hypothetical protein [Mycobacterium sp. 1465703.0]OBJ01134.1 hypothetical protein A5625_25775 [Mycobacterium sp. 1465703.0]
MNETVVAAIVAAAPAIVAAAFAGWQIRYLAKQTEQANKVAGSSELRGIFDSFHNVLRYLLEEPAFQPCFFNGADWRKLDAELRSSAELLAEMFADVLEDGLLTTRLHPATESRGDFERFSRYLLDQSPVLMHVVGTRPHWFWKEVFVFYREKLVDDEKASGQRTKAD